MSSLARVPSLVVLSLACAGAAGAGDPEAMPAHFRAFLMVVDENAVSDGQQALPGSHGMPAPIQEGRASKDSAMVSITIDRWCSADERAHITEGQASGGTRAVLAALRETEVGSIQVGDGPRRSIRWASYWKSGDVTRVSLAVLERLLPQNYDHGALPPTSQPIVILEFSVPPVDDGEGTLVTVTEAGFDSHGNIEAESVPPDGVERLTGVTRVSGRKHDKK